MIKLFNEWDTSNVEVKEKALQPYIGLDPVLVPRSHGRYAYNRFWAVKANIVERLINRLMVPGHKGKKHFLTSSPKSGKKENMTNVVYRVFKIIEKKMNKNPVEVLVRAIENAAPREEITSIEYGGARYPQAVEVAPQRRVDITLKLMVQGSFQKSFNKKRKIDECLAEEIMLAYNMDNKSSAIAKKLELERQADASR